MWRLLVHSTFLLLTLLLSVAASHAEERRTGVLAQGRKAGRTKEETDMHDEGEEDEEGADEAESQNLDQKDRGDGLVGAKSRMILTNALQRSLKEFESPEDAKRNREMALRVRELLSRLPIIPLTQKPVLHKETLVATGPSLAPGVPHDPVAAGGPAPPGAIHTAGGLVFTDPAAAVHAARMAVSQLDKNPYMTDELPEDRLQPPPPAAPVATRLYGGGRAPPQDMPAAYRTGDEQYQAAELPLPYLDRPDDAAITPGTAEPQPVKSYPPLAYVSRGELQIPDPHPFSAPAEFVQLFGIMNALSTLVDWVGNMKNEIMPSDSDNRAAGTDDAAEEKCDEDEVKEKTDREQTTKKQGDEELTEEGHPEKKDEKMEASYKALRAAQHPEN